MTGGYTILDHTADTGIEASAGSLTELVRRLATGMFELMSTADPCSPTGTVELEVPAASPDDVVFEALSQLLYESEVQDLLFCDFEVSEAPDGGLRIAAGGMPSKEATLTGPPIKAVTYHDLMVARDGPRWLGRVFFDV